MRVILLIFAALIVCFFGIIGWYRWDSAYNRGYEHGYFGDINRVSNALASIRGVTITQSWHNLDITVEEFGFGLTVTGQPVRVSIGETDPIRDMSRAAAIAELHRRIAEELASTKTNR